MSNDADDNNNDDDDDDDERDHVFADSSIPTPVDNRQWQRLAQDDVQWNALEEGFCQR